MEEKKENKGLIIVVIILSLLTIGMGGFIVYDKVLSSSNASNKETTNSAKDEDTADEEEKNTTTDETNSDTSVSQEDNTTNTSKCVGRYYGEAEGTYSDGVSYNLKYTYVLNADGTFTATFGDTSGTSGVYVINDNTISFVGKKHTVGPRDQDPYYSTEDYVIADDCSYILVNDETPFKITKQ